MHPARPILIGRRNTVFVLGNSCSAQVHSSSSLLLLPFPTSFFPRKPSQVVRSVPTLALKSHRRNSFSCRGTDLTSLSRSSTHLSFTSSGFVMVGAYALMMVAWCLLVKGSLLTKQLFTAKPTPDSRRSFAFHPLHKNVYLSGVLHKPRVFHSGWRSVQASIVCECAHVPCA